jgi:hypothetical protein
MLRMFNPTGRRGRRPLDSNAPAAMETQLKDPLPWQPQSEIRGNLAIGNLRENMLRFLAVEGGVHAQTLLAAMGALAGFAAQNAALNRAAAATSSDGQVPFDGLVLAEGKSGERWLAGNWINVHLFNEAGSVLPVWGFLAGAAVQAGAPLQELADTHEIVRHVATTRGGADYGKLRAPAEHQPSLPPNELLRRSWPLACQVFAHPLPAEMSETGRDEPPLDEAHWPIIVAIVTSQFIPMTKDVVDPRITFALALESAVISSKVDPEQIEPGKWDIQAAAGRLTVRRNRN